MICAQNPLRGINHRIINLSSVFFLLLGTINVIDIRVELCYRFHKLAKRLFSSDFISQLGIMSVWWEGLPSSSSSSSSSRRLLTPGTKTGESERAELQQKFSFWEIETQRCRNKKKPVEFQAAKRAKLSL